MLLLSLWKRLQFLTQRFIPYPVKFQSNGCMLSAPYIASCEVIGSAYKRLVISVTATATPTLNNPAPVGSRPPRYDVKYSRFDRF
jgi:hypothetical protein